ncbi:MAG: hypothetical protein ACM3PF_04270 [Bacteroidota bacterium]
MSRGSVVSDRERAGAIARGPLLAAWTAAAVLLLVAGAARAQVSPGPLASAHEHWDNLTACFQCHSRTETMTQRCLACHIEIAWYRVKRRGFHARVAATECAKCHPDHAGRDFAMVHWDEGAPEKFRHDRTGWPLTGAHARVACRSCHKVENQRAAVAKEIRKLDHAASWLGLETTCASCHQDPHAGRFGADCARCHRTTAWKEISRTGFDHEKTRFPLRGKHAAVACASCHDEKTAWGPKPAFAACGDCHKDAHAGTATLAGKAADCAACHDVNGFATSTYTVERHAKSAYPLTGRHATVACRDCHTRETGAAAAGLGTARVRLRPRFDRCERCHEDAHGGQLMYAAPGGAAVKTPETKGKSAGNGASSAASASAHTGCADCHTTAAYKPSTFRVKDHAATRFALEGAHAATACRDCHGVDRGGLPAPAGHERAGRAGFVFHIAELECASCHVDPHAGRFAARGARPDPRGCVGCHGVDAFRPASYDVERHAHSRFPLEGAHRATPCGQCHTDLRGNGSRPPASLIRAAARPAPLLFQIEKRACADCHQNPHGAQFKGRKGGGACETCHGLDAFRPASRFNHDRDAAFKLRGAHANVACERCHKAGRDRSGARVTLYTGVSTRCEDCHAS